MKIIPCLFLMMGGGVFLSPASSLAAGKELKVLPPAEGAYQGAYADFGPAEDQVTEERIQAFEELSGKKMVWAYFSNHWFDGALQFPQASIEACRRRQVIPYVRMSPWSEMVQSRRDPKVNMEGILRGDFDRDLRLWARRARDSETAIMIEFGPEANGSWFPWNGKWNGGSKKTEYGDPEWPDGPERFRDAYRRIIDLFREEGARNITWVLHVDVAWAPQAGWNHMKHYYPGDDYIDWIGLSVFGRQLPKNEWLYFPTVLKAFWPQIEATTSKPVLISEFGVIEDKRKPGRKAAWLTQALQSISRGPFKNVKGVTYWNSPGWYEDERASFKISSSPASLEAYRTELSSGFWLENALLGSSEEP